MNLLVLPVTAFQQNCSIVWDRRGRAAVIDPGGDTDRLLAALAEHKLTLEKILITHGHVDHAAAAAELAARTRVPIEGPHREDKFWIDQLPDAAQRYGFAPARTFEPDRWLSHGDSVSVGEETFEVLHCPGHTPGHVVFFARAQRFAWVGDVLFAGSIGRSDFPRGDHAVLLASIREVLFPLGDEVRFLPGHGPMSTFGQERRTNPFVADALFAASR
jgi:glyoxylase-like metal-dependent hydrolase (beta-lactamase superfamily II)